MAEGERAEPGTTRQRRKVNGAGARRTVNLALQGGGSHGAFTWGVLDAVLEDGRIDFEGISGTSAGAMNAVVLASALARANEQGLDDAATRDAARKALARFWDGVGLLGTFMAGIPMSGTQAMASLFTQWFSPAQVNPLGLNPLRSLLKREVDFELLARQTRVKVFLNATNIRTGRGEIFSGQRVSAEPVSARGDRQRILLGRWLLRKPFHLPVDLRHRILRRHASADQPY